MVLGIVRYGSIGVIGKFVAVGGLRVLLDCSTWPGRQLLFVVVGPPANVRVLVVALLVVPPPPRQWCPGIGQQTRTWTCVRLQTGLGALMPVDSSNSNSHECDRRDKWGRWPGCPGHVCWEQTPSGHEWFCWSC